jgi:hypothetical protein
MCQGVCVLEIISNWENPYYLIYHLTRGRNIVKLLMFNFLFLPYFSFVSNYSTGPFCEEPQLFIFSMQNQSWFAFPFIQEQLRLTTKTHKQREIITFLQQVNSEKINVSEFMTGFGEDVSATFHSW